MRRNAFTSVALLHAAFQLVVSTRLYPALAAVPPDRWRPAHDAHSRRIVPWVVAVYGAVLLTAGPAVREPAGAVRTALAAEVVAVVLTAVAAAPLHRRLGRGYDLGDVRRLLVVDRVRTAAALVGAAAALAGRSGSR